MSVEINQVAVHVITVIGFGLCFTTVKDWLSGIIEKYNVISLVSVL